MESVYYTIIALALGFLLDQLLGDPEGWPHPIVGFGWLISFMEKRLNKGQYLIAKGALMTLTLVFSIYFITTKCLEFLEQTQPVLGGISTAILVFYCLSAKTLRKEVRLVFRVLNSSLENGRKQLSRIVGRDTNKLSAQQIRTSALETLSENLSDGVIAPLFWFALLGVPGMLAYKMINTLDSMIGYKNDKYLLFGKFAARLDDAANFIPARLTALIMLIVSNQTGKLKTVFQNGKNHASPNSGYPEAALAVILNCRFGGPNYYFGDLVQKPFIGTNDRELTSQDMNKALKINQLSEIAMLLLVLISIFSIQLLIHSFQ
jgi:adenosylcobinamide-phosphate synthase